MAKNLGWMLLLLGLSSCLMAQPVNLPHIASLMNLSEQGEGYFATASLSLPIGKRQTFGKPTMT
jgi:hypothetical protein